MTKNIAAPGRAANGADETSTRKSVTDSAALTDSVAADVASESVSSPTRRTLLTTSVVAGAGALLLGASPGQADILRSLKGFLYLDPLVQNFAFEMEELESEFFLRALRSDAYANLSPRAQSVFNLIAHEDREHFEAINKLRDRNGQKGGGHFESMNASSSRRPGLFYFPNAFRSTKSLMATALDIKETALLAYHGAVDLVDKNTLMLAAAIAGVEGRHLAVLRELSGIDPVPAPFEAALSPDQVGNRLKKYGFNGGGYGNPGGNR